MVASAAPPHAHVQRKDKNRVQNDVEYRADEDREHAGAGESLRGDEGVQAQRHLHGDGTQRVNRQIVPCVADGLLVGAEDQQRLAAEDQDDRRQQHRHHHEGHGAVAQNTLCILLAALAHHNGGAGGAAHAGECRKGTHQQNHRQGHAQAGQSRGSHHRDVADVHTVHHIVEHIHHLRGDGRKRQAEQKPANRSCTQFIFLALHVAPP